MIIDVLEDTYPGKLEINEISKLTGYSRTSIAKAALEMVEKGWLEMEKTHDEVFFRMKRDS